MIEPYLSLQWYVKVEPLAEAAIKAVQDGRTRIVPAQWEKTYFEWMFNIQRLVHQPADLVGAPHPRLVLR